MKHKIVKDWTTEAGLRAMILLVNDGSHHCGYVALPYELKDKNFQWYSEEAGELLDINVHGGVTYHEALYLMDNLIVVGFDCAHCDDKTKYSPNGEWRDEAYCIEQCESMAKQIMEFMPKQIQG